MPSTLDPRPLPPDEAGLRRRAFAVAAALLVAAGASGCSSQFGSGGDGGGEADARPAPFRPASVKAGFRVAGDASHILRESAEDSLEAAAMACREEADDCTDVRLRARLVDGTPAFDFASPPVRVVELLATYRLPSSAASTTRSYQRTVPIRGRMSTATWMRVSDALMNDFAADLAFQTTTSGVVLRLPAWATEATDVPRSEAPEAFHVAITGDTRADEDAAGLVGDSPLRLARAATDYLTETLTDDLRAAGHTIVPARDGRLVGTELARFWVNADREGWGWKTTVEIELALEVAPPPGEKRRKAELHGCSVSDRSAGRPDEQELTGLVRACVSSLLGSIREDPAWSPGAAISADSGQD